MRSSARFRLVVAATLLACGTAALDGATAKSSYDEVLGREELLRRDLDGAPANSDGSPLLHRIHRLVREYEELATRHPRSGYSDNALFQAAMLAADAFWHFGEDADRRLALRLFSALKARFPTSSLNRQVPMHATRLEAAATAPVTATLKPDERPMLKAIRRDALPDALRITLELEREAPFHDERIDGPPRVFVDLQNTRAVDALKDAVIGFPDDVVRQIRVGRRSGSTRVVLDLQGVGRHSVYALYDPYRVVIDCERIAGHQPHAGADRQVGPDSQVSSGAAWTAAPPAAAAANKAGGFSIARQLGLGISRVVVDAGHGGHDPGAKVKGLNEADLTLDVAMRVEKLLLKLPGVEVVMTRRTNVYIPLEERTAIANRAAADLFLSIHANASPNPRTRGIETYFLNFAPNAEAEAIAARENAGSSRTMHHLPDIVKAIALNNKIDESRDFATLVQTSMVERLKKANRDAKSLGVKQAPFMVLIGATMPSVLAEISFVTNREEARLLRTPAYRQAIAEALVNGISTYQKSLKAAATVAAQ